MQDITQFLLFNSSSVGSTFACFSSKWHRDRPIKYYTDRIKTISLAHFVMSVCLSVRLSICLNAISSKLCMQFYFYTRRKYFSHHILYTTDLSVLRFWAINLSKNHIGAWNLLFYTHTMKYIRWYWISSRSDDIL